MLGVFIALGIAVVWLLEVLWRYRFGVFIFLCVAWVVGAVAEGFETVRHGTVATRLEGVTFTPLRTLDVSTRNMGSSDMRAEIRIENNSDRTIDNLDGYCGDIYISDPDPIPARTTVVRRYFYIDESHSLGECVIDDVDVVA